MDLFKTNYFLSALLLLSSPVVSLTSTLCSLFIFHERQGQHSRFTIHVSRFQPRNLQNLNDHWLQTMTHQLL